MHLRTLCSRPVRLVLSLFVLAGAFVAAKAQSSFVTPYTVSTYAGLPNASGAEDGYARAAWIGTLGGMVYGADGTLYFTESEYHTVRKLDPSGVVTLVAGRAGSRGFVNSAGNAARFDTPEGLAIDGEGNLYVADKGNRVIRRVTPEGVVSTYAGSGVSGVVDASAGGALSARFRSPESLAFDAAGNLYVGDTAADNVRRVSPSGEVTTVVAAGAVESPTSLAVAADGTIIIAERSRHTVRARRPSGLIELIAGSSGRSGSGDGIGAAARFNLPSTLALADADTLLVGDSRSLRRIDLASNEVATVVGDVGWGESADGTSAQFTNPEQIAIAPDRVVAVASHSQRTVFAVPEFGEVNRVLGGLVGVDRHADGEGLHGLSAKISKVGGVVVAPDGTIYFTDSFQHVVRRIRPDGEVETVAGLAGSTDHQIVNGTGAEARFQSPMGIALDASGNLYVADHQNDAIRKITPEGVVTTFAGGDGQFMLIENLVFNPADGSFFVADWGRNQILRVSPSGGVSVYAGTGDSGLLPGPAPEAKFANPSALALAEDGTLYVSDRAGVGHVIWKITPDGMVSLFAGSTTKTDVVDATGLDARFFNLSNLAMGPDGHLYASELSKGILRRISPEGVVTSLAGGGNGYVDATGPAARIGEIVGLAVDAKGRIFFGDGIGNTLRMAVPATSVPSLASATSANGYAGEPFSYQALASAGATVAGAYPLPPGLVFDPANGRLPGEAPASGTYAVTFRLVNEITESFATVDITLAPARVIAQIDLAGLAVFFDGAAHAATVSTVPAGLPVTILYDGSPNLPIARGSYTVTAMVDTPAYRGFATGTLVIGQGQATVSLQGLRQGYDGEPRAVIVTTNPPGLDVVVTYDGSTTPPSAVGSYEVVATVSDPDYAGSVSGTLVVSEQEAGILLGGLERVYTGSSILPSVVTIPAGLNVVLTYDGASTTPVDAGSYLVRAVISDASWTGEAEAVLNIAKAPLTVIAEDRSRFLNQSMPEFLLRYEGFVGGDTVANLSDDRPAISTPATETSPVGEYSITASGGSDKNYVYQHVPGVLRVGVVPGSYEALLRDEDDVPRGSLTVTVASKGLTYSGTLLLADEKLAISLKSASRPAGSKVPHGPFVPTFDEETGPAVASAVWRRTATTKLPALELLMTITTDGVLDGVLIRDGSPFATLEHGRRLRTGKTGAPGAGAYTLRLAPPERHVSTVEDARRLPEGAGHAMGKINAAGRMTFRGRLPDNTLWTAAAPQDEREAYRVYVEPHGAARLGNMFAGRLELEANPLGIAFRRVVSAELIWNKPAGAKDKSYREGFGPVVTDAKLAVWRAPVADNRRTPQNDAITHAHRLGLLPPGVPPADVAVEIEFAGEALDDDQRLLLPDVRTLSSRNQFPTVAKANNPSGFLIKGVVHATGAFSGSFKVPVEAPTRTKPDATVMKSVSFSGVFIQPDGGETDGRLIGSGVFMVPGANSPAGLSAGAIRLLDPAAE